MKKILILSGAMCLLATLPAEARVNLNFDFGVPQPTYYAPEPAPAYVVAPEYPAYYRHRHYYHDRHRR